MADILKDYPATIEPKGNRAECGGVRPGEEKDVMNYSPPRGPKYVMTEGPGLRGGTNHGNCGSQGRH